MKKNYPFLKNRVWLFLLIVFCNIGGLKAQNNSGTITGKVSAPGAEQVQEVFGQGPFLSGSPG